MHFLKLSSRMYLTLCIVLVTCVSLFHSDFKSLWLDEAYSIFMAQQNFNSLFHIIWTQDGNAWLYYFLLHFWIKLGISEFVVRGLSATFAILAIFSTYISTSKFFNNKVAKITIFLLSLNAFFIAYAQEARGYMLLILLTTLSNYFFIKSIKNSDNQNLILYIIITAASFYTHLFTALIVMSQILTLFIYKKKKIFTLKTITSYFLVLMLILPLFIAPSFRSGQLNSISSLTIRDVASIFLALAGGLPLLLVFYYTILLGGIIIPLRRNSFEYSHSFEYHLTLISFLFPILFTFLFSIFVKPIYDTKYLLITLVPFIVLCSISLNEIQKLNKKTFLMLLFCLVILSLSSIYVLDSGKKYIFGFWSISKPVEDFRGATNFILNNAKPGDALIMFAYHIRRPVDYYLSQDQNKLRAKYLNVLELSSSSYYPGGGSFVPDPDTNLLNNLHYKYIRVWLILSHHRYTQLGRDKQSLLIQNYLNKSYKLTIEKTFFEDVNVYLYQ